MLLHMLQQLFVDVHQEYNPTEVKFRQCQDQRGKVSVGNSTPCLDQKIRALQAIVYQFEVTQCSWEVPSVIQSVAPHGALPTPLDAMFEQLPQVH